MEKFDAIREHWSPGIAGKETFSPVESSTLTANQKNARAKILGWISAAATAGALALAPGEAGADDHKHRGHVRLGVETVANTVTTNEGSNSVHAGFFLPRPEIFPGWVDTPSVGLGLLSVKNNGFILEPEIMWGMTFNAGKYFSANLSTAFGLENCFTGLDNDKTKSFAFSPYMLPRLTANFFIPVDGENKFIISAFEGVKQHLMPVHFKYEEYERTETQAFYGVNLAFAKGESFEIGTNIAHYPTDHAANEKITVWGDTYVSVPF